MREQLMLGWFGAGLVALLCGCAANTQSTSAGEKPEPDCSFRSATTCWTVSGRFPAPRSRPAAAPLEPTPSQASAVLANGPDSASSRQ
jgi:hypothetical protein